jgi:hypothetical protein
VYVHRVARHHVFLVPGFFGFANLGEFFYFAHLADELAYLFRQAGHEVVVTRVHTHPTASIRARARRLYDSIEEHVTDEDEHLHIIGHSSGGLDARLLLGVGADVGADADVEKVAARVRSLLTVATPHHGTPIASFFDSRLGAQALRVLSIATLHALRFGTVPLRALLKIATVFTKLDDVVGAENGLLDQLFKELLGDFSEDRQRQVEAFFSEVGEEQAIVTQLAPEAVELFNAGLVEREDLRCASIVTRAKKPQLSGALDFGFNAYAQATHALYAILYREVAKSPIDLAKLPVEHTDRVRKLLGDLPEPGENDGVVPTMSQPFGDVLCVANADHLDVIGHFYDPEHEPPHVDWVATGSGFTRQAFDDLWRQATRWLLDE